VTASYDFKGHPVRRFTHRGALVFLAREVGAALERGDLPQDRAGARGDVEPRAGRPAGGVVGLLEPRDGDLHAVAGVPGEEGGPLMKKIAEVRLAGPDGEELLFRDGDNPGGFHATARGTWSGAELEEDGGLALVRIVLDPSDELRRVFAQVRDSLTDPAAVAASGLSGNGGEVTFLGDAIAFAVRAGQLRRHWLTERLSPDALQEAIRSMTCPDCGAVLLEYCDNHKEDAFIASVLPGVLEQLTEGDA
jgi:hypothetical protein